MRGALAREAPATWGQQFMWEVADRLDGGGALLTLSVVVPVPEGGRYSDVEESVRALCARHDALRTRFVGDSLACLQQQVAGELAVPVHLRDTGPLADGEDPAEALDRDLRAPGFSLGGEPLVRVGVVGPDDSPSVVILVMSHLIVDGWSVQRIHDDLTRLMSGARCEDEPSGQPVDQACFEQSEEGARLGRASLDHQRRVFERLPRAIPGGDRFPADAPRFRQGVLSTPRTFRAARDAGRLHKVSVSAVLLSVSVMLLADLSGTREVPVLLWTHNRLRPASRRIVGQHTQVIPTIFTAPEASPSCAGDYVRGVQLGLLQALSYGQYPPQEAADLRRDFERRTGTDLPLGFRFNHMAGSRFAGADDDRSAAEEVAAFEWAGSAEKEDVVASIDVRDYDESVALFVDSMFLPPARVEEALREFESLTCFLAR